MGNSMRRVQSSVHALGCGWGVEALDERIPERERGWLASTIYRGFCRPYQGSIQGGMSAFSQG